jgi:hypothetical protein
MSASPPATADNTTPSESGRGRRRFFEKINKRTTNVYENKGSLIIAVRSVVDLPFAAIEKLTAWATGRLCPVGLALPGKTLPGSTLGWRRHLWEERLSSEATTSYSASRGAVVWPMLCYVLIRRL